ncbi:Hsp20/alpha crystallin family protein [Bacillus sp. NPDC077027]|uniref:Hsp20/alpha crystallin family protein n=1 Tax=Bacillus sp. NPDC077027 TaxID=3390548 RepID=UPI003D04B426
MDNEKQENSSDFLRTDDWLHLLLDDPFAWYDEQLPIDLYETSCEYIIEVDISALSIRELKLTFSGHELILSYAENRPKHEDKMIEKSIMLPFYLNDKKIETECENRILSIKIQRDTLHNDGIFSFQMSHLDTL